MQFLVRFQACHVCLIATHVVSHPKPMVKPQAMPATTRSSVVTSWSSKLGERSDMVDVTYGTINLEIAEVWIAWRSIYQRSQKHLDQGIFSF